MIESTVKERQTSRHAGPSGSVRVSEDGWGHSCTRQRQCAPLLCGTCYHKGRVSSRASPNLTATHTHSAPYTQRKVNK